MLRLSAALALILSGASLALAQEQDPEKVKKEILDKVRARIQEEHQKILDRLGRIIDEELAKGTPKTPSDPPPAAGGSGKRIRELQKKLIELEDQRDDIMKEIRAFKREEEDAPVVKDARKEVPEDDPDAVHQMFKEYLDTHTEALETLKKGDRDEGLKGFAKSIRGFKMLYYSDYPDRHTRAISAYNVACGYALAGDKEQALDWIEISIKAGYGAQAGEYDHMRQDTDLDSLRKERRYQKIMLDK